MTDLEDCAVQDMVAVCCTDKADAGKARSLDSEYALLFWDLKEQSQPECTLLSSSGILCFDINPIAPALVIAGCCNGGLVLWDKGELKVGVATTRSLIASGKLFPAWALSIIVVMLIRQGS